MRRSSGSSSEPNGTSRPGPSLVAVAVDDPLGVRGVLRVHRDPQLVDRQRKRRARHVRRDHRRDPVRLEQAADDVRLDLRRRAEDDDEVGHRIRPPRAPTAANAWSTLSRIIVMSSCWSAPPTNASTSRMMRSRSSPDSRWPCSSTMRLRRALAEQIALDVHRLGDAVGVEHDHVARRQVDALLFEQRLELLRRPVDAQAEHHAAWASAPARRAR